MSRDSLSEHSSRDHECGLDTCGFVGYEGRMALIEEEDEVATKRADNRSIVVLVEPVFGSDETLWHGMAIVGGYTMCNVTEASSREKVLNECLQNVAAAAHA